MMEGADGDDLRPLGEDDDEDDANNFDTFGGDTGAIGDDWLPSNAQAAFEHERHGFGLGSSGLRPGLAAELGTPPQAARGGLPPAGLPQLGGAGSAMPPGLNSGSLFQPGAIAARLEQALGAAARQPPPSSSVDDSEDPPGLIPPHRSPARRPVPADVDGPGLLDGVGLPPTAGLDALGLGAALGLTGRPPSAGLTQPPPLSSAPGGLGTPGATAAGLAGLGSLGSLAGLLPPNGPPPPPLSYQEYAAAMSAYAAASRGLLPPPYGSGCAPPGLHGAGRGLMPSVGSAGRLPPGLGAGPTLADFMSRPLGPPATPPAAAGGLRGIPPCGAPGGLGGLAGTTPSSAAALAAMAAATAKAASLAPPQRPAAPAPVRPGAADASSAARPPKVLSVTELEQQMLTSSLTQPASARKPQQAPPLATTVPHTSLKATPRAAKAGSAAIADLGLAAAWAGTSVPAPAPSASLAPPTGTLPTAVKVADSLPGALPEGRLPAAEQPGISSQKLEDAQLASTALLPEARPVVPFLQRHRTALIAGADKADAQQFIPPKDPMTHPQIMGASDKELVSRIQLSQLAALTTNPRLLFGQPLAFKRIASEAEATCTGLQSGDVPPKAVLQEKLSARLKGDGEALPSGSTETAPVTLEANEAAEESAPSVVRAAQMQCERAFAAVVELEQLSPQAAKADATPAEQERTEKAWREILPQIAAVIAPAALEVKGSEVSDSTGSDCGEVTRVPPGEVCRNLLMMPKGRTMARRLLLYLALAVGTLAPALQPTDSGEAPADAGDDSTPPELGAPALLILGLLWQVISVFWLPDYAPKELLIHRQPDATWNDFQLAFSKAAGTVFPRGGKLCLYALGALLGVVKVPLASSEASGDDSRASEQACRRVFSLCSSQAGVRLVIALLSGRRNSLPMQESIAAALEPQLGPCPAEELVLDTLCDALCRVAAQLREVAATSKKLDSAPTDSDAAGNANSVSPSGGVLEEEDLLELFLTLAESASESQMLQLRQCRLLAEIAQQ